jgi:hypothetical protein
MKRLLSLSMAFMLPALVFGSEADLKIPALGDRTVQYVTVWFSYLHSWTTLWFVPIFTGKKA